MVSSLLLGAGFALLAAAALAAQSLSVRLSARTHRVSDVVAAMFVVNLAVLLPVAAVVGYPEYGIGPTSLAAFAAAGLLGSFAARLWYFVGIARLGASRTEPLKALFPLVAVGTAVVLLGEQVTPLLALGVGVLTAGGIAAAAEARASAVTTSGTRFWRDVSYPLGAALCLGIDPVFTKVGLSAGTPALVGVAVRTAAAAAGFALFSLWRRTNRGSVGAAATNRWVLAASVANTGYLLAYYAALAVTPVAVVTPLLGVSTLFVVGSAAVILPREERVTRRLVGAATLVVLGAVLVVRG